MLLAMAALCAPPIEAAAPVWGPEPEASDLEDLTKLDIEDLINIDVTIASRTPQSISDVPAAAYVIPGDEIRRAGHSSIQEALRMVPGFYVSHWQNEMWDVTARGFGTGLSFANEAYLNQLLVMIDGVVVYSPLFAGTWWALQEVDLADVDRIEVIRGPGGIVWGANTVHGVVNIITKHSEDTLGTRVDGRLTTDQWDTSVRAGTTLGENGHVRVWAKRTQYDTPHAPWLGVRSDYDMDVAGFRADWKGKSGLEYMAWGRAYNGDFRDVGWEWLGYWQGYFTTSEKHGGQFAFSITDREARSRWQAYYTRDQQNVPFLYDQDIDVLDLEYQKDFELTDRQRITWGAGYQMIHSDLHGDDFYWFSFDPISQVQNNFRGFLLDTIAFPDQNLHLVLGAQALHTEFADFDLQPSARLRWNPSERFMAWCGVSRAVRTPSLEEVSLSNETRYAGNPDFTSEELLAYELGFRHLMSDKVAIDVATFYNQYDKLHVVVGDSTALYGGRIRNKGDGSAYGLEVAVDMKPTDNWSMRGTCSYLHSEIEYRPTGQALSVDEYAPQSIFTFRSYYDLGNNWELDGGLYGVHGFGDAYDSAEYWRVDMRLGWKPTENLTLSFGMQNLCDPHHPEYGGANQNEIRRAAYLQLIYSK